MRGASLIGIVLAMFFVAALVVLYMRVFLPSAPDVQQKASAIDRARDTAAAVEEQQKRYDDQLRRQLQPDGGS